MTTEVKTDLLKDLEDIGVNVDADEFQMWGTEDYQEATEWVGLVRARLDNGDDQFPDAPEHVKAWMPSQWDPRDVLPESDAESATDDESEQVKSKLDRQNRWRRDVLDAEREVQEKESIEKDLKEQHKEAKKDFEAAVSRLRAMIRRNPDQNELPFPEDDQREVKQESNGKPVDEAGQNPISVLDLTEKQVENLNAADIKSVADLEERIRTDEWWHTKISGFGPAKVDQLTDKLVEYRRENPVPGEAKDEPPEAEPVEAPNEVDGALSLCTEIMQMCDQVPEAGEGFAESVRGNTQEIVDWIEKNGHVTESQQEALGNMHGGLQNWIDNDNGTIFDQED